MYVEYFRTIGLGLIVPILVLYTFQQGASLAYNYWLSMWADEPIVNGTQLNADMKLGVYGALGFAQGQWTLRLQTSLNTNLCVCISETKYFLSLYFIVLTSNYYLSKLQALQFLAPQWLSRLGALLHLAIYTWIC